MAVQGAVASPAAAAELGARAAALPAQVEVKLVNEAGVPAATDVVTPATDPNFSLTVPAGHDYVMVFTDKGTGQEVGVLQATATPGPAFSLPPNSPDVNLGDVAVNPKTGKAECAAAEDLDEPSSASVEADSDDDGVPDVCGDDDPDEDDDGVDDVDDDLDFDDSEHVDTDHDGIGNNADSDDDGDDVDDSVDTDDDGDGIDDSVDPDDDNDGTPDDEENPAP